MRFPALINDAEGVLRHAWSVRLMLLAAVLSGVEVALPLLEPWLSIPGWAFGAAAGVSAMAAFIARFVAQQKISGATNGNK